MLIAISFGRPIHFCLQNSISFPIWKSFFAELRCETWRATRKVFQNQIRIISKDAFLKAMTEHSLLSQTLSNKESYHFFLMRGVQDHCEKARWTGSPQSRWWSLEILEIDTKSSIRQWNYGCSRSHDYDLMDDREREGGGRRTKKTIRRDSTIQITAGQRTFDFWLEKASPLTKFWFIYRDPL